MVMPLRKADEPNVLTRRDRSVSVNLVVLFINYKITSSLLLLLLLLFDTMFVTPQEV